MRISLATHRGFVALMHTHLRWHLLLRAKAASRIQIYHKPLLRAALSCLQYFERQRCYYEIKKSLIEGPKQMNVYRKPVSPKPNEKVYSHLVLYNIWCAMSHAYKTGISDSICLAAGGGRVWVRLGRIRFSTRKALIKTSQCSKISSFLF